MKFDLDGFLGIVSLIGPAILAAIPGGAQMAVLIPVIVTAIKEAEALKDATGPEKKAHVLNIVDASVTVANAVGNVHLDPVKVHDVASSGIDTVIGTISLIEGAHVVKPALPNG